MNGIDWIKTAIKVCIDDQLPDSEKNILFEELGNRYTRFSAEEKTVIAKTIKEQFAQNDGIYIYSVFLQYMGNQDFAECVMDLMLEGEFDAYTGSMLEVQVFKYMKEFKWAYAKIRQLHKRNIEAFQQVLQVDDAYVKPQNRNSKRIVLVTEQMLSSLHAPSKIVSEFAYMLKQLGYEILLFVCPCDGVLPQELWYGLYRMNSIPVLNHMPMRMYYRNQEFLGYQINMDQKNMKEYHMMLSMIRAWNPIFVLDLGTINPVVDLVGRFTTLVAMEMSILCPVSEASILIRLGREEEALEQEYHAALLENQTQLFMDENIPVLVQETDRVCPRSETGLPQGRFLIAIVGNRLDLEIDDRFLSVMGEILVKLPKADFVVIGDTVTCKQKMADGIFKDRVYFLGYLPNLMEVYGSLDLYLNPNRPGGGFSSAMALIAGLPVVTLPNCDVAYNVGDAFVVPDYEHMVQIVERYAKDQDFYEKKKMLAHDYEEKNTAVKMEAYVKKLLDGVLRLMDSQEEKDAGI